MRLISMKHTTCIPLNISTKWILLENLWIPNHTTFILHGAYYSVITISYFPKAFFLLSSPLLLSQTFLPAFPSLSLPHPSLTFPAHWRGRLSHSGSGEVGCSSSQRTGSSGQCPHPAPEGADICYWKRESKPNATHATDFLTCSLPHSLHLSQPTQSMIREMFLKCIRNSFYRGEETEGKAQQSIIRFKQRNDEYFSKKVGVK